MDDREAHGRPELVLQLLVKVAVPGQGRSTLTFCLKAGLPTAACECRDKTNLTVICVRLDTVSNGSSPCLADRHFIFVCTAQQGGFRPRLTDPECESNSSGGRLASQLFARRPVPVCTEDRIRVQRKFQSSDQVRLSAVVRSDEVVHARRDIEIVLARKTPEILNADVRQLH